MATENIRAVLFDADGTLFDFDRAQEISLYETLSLAEGSAEAARALPLYRAHNHAVWAEYEQGLIDRDTLRVERFRRLKADFSFDVPLEEASAAFLERLATKAFLLDGAVEAVRHCKSRGLRVALATNGFSAVQRGRLSRSPLKDDFDGLFVSEEMGTQKPQEEYFQKALEGLGLTAGQCLMVGDSPEADISGAKRAGMAAFWVNPQGKEFPKALERPDRVLPSVAAFAETFAEWGRR
jgi:YjjG family noncanonical pyrimidine nucleotidase